MDKSLLKTIRSSFLTSLIAITGIICLAGCNAELVDEPNIIRNTTGGSTTTLSIPQNVKASQGDFRSVTISWKGCNAASFYRIYSADTTYDSFIQCGESKGNAEEVKITQPSGTTKYYRVKAVRYDGTESEFSNWTLGTTLAKPVITSLSTDSSNNSCTITWWLENCNSKTYLSNVKYLIQGKKGTETSPSIKQVVDGSSGLDIYVIPGLEGRSDYIFTVSAYTEINGVATKYEVSSEASVATAHRLIPMPPADFEATTGTSKDEIVLSWKLPSTTDVEKEDGTYTATDNFFALYRKPAVSEDSAFEIIKVFASNTAVKEISGQTYTPVSFGTYTVGETVSYTDEDISEYGYKYDYKIKAFVDTTKGKTSTVSESRTTGWLISKPSLSTSATYVKNEDETKFESATVSFAPVFDTLGKDDLYSYVLVETRKDLERDSTISEGWPRIVGQSNSFTTACKDIVFTDMTQDGYYHYCLYIIPRVTNDSDYANYETTKIIEAAASGKTTITDDTSAVPNLESVSIEDGYKDCFKLSWIYDKDCTYILSWTSENGTTESGTYTLTSKDTKNAVNGESFTFEHKGGSNPSDDPAVISGEKRLYTVTADKGITKSITAENYALTLGTAKPVMADNSYKSITVRWPAVQMATEYSLSCKFKENGNDCTATIPDATEKTIDGIDYIEYTLNDIQGYSDANISGKEIVLNVKATNVKSSTDNNIDVCIIGPALTKPNIGAADSDKIIFQWKKAIGATGYLVHRQIALFDSATYGAQNSTDEGESQSPYKDSSNAISYYISADLETIEAGGEARNSDCVEVTYNEATSTYTLVDKYHESNAENPGAYEFSQAAISWGVPFTYSVVPLKNGLNDMKVNTSTEKHEIAIKEDGGKSYTNLTYCEGSTYGYGHNVMTSKCENDQSLTISWRKPAKITFAPHLYYRPAGSTENKWYQVNANLNMYEEKYVLNFAKDFPNADIYKAYEFAVDYFNNVDEHEIPESFIADRNNGGLSSLEITGEGKRYSYSDNKSVEKKNKGYLLTIQPITAKFNGTSTERLYEEEVKWHKWNYAERAIGPDSYVLYMKNKNLINADYKDNYNNVGWVKILSLGADSNPSNFDEEQTKALSNDISLSTQGTALYVTAVSLTNGSAKSTDGMMKVLRDARHYYELVAIRDEFKTVSGGDESVFAFRQITEEELIKATMLAMTEGMEKIGKFDFENENHNDNSNNGTVKGFHNANAQIGKEYHITFTDYCANFKTPEGSNSSILKVNTVLVGYRNSSLSGSYPVSFNSCTIEVEPFSFFNKSDEDKLTSYKATITFELKSKSNVTFSIKSYTTTINSDELRRSWIPWQFYNDDNWYYHNSKYGWWPTK